MALEIQQYNITRFIFLVALLLTILFTLVIVSLSVGSSMVSIMDVFFCIIRLGCDRTTEIIINYRFTRTVTALLVGALLAVSGMLMQSIARNPLAEPYILGLSSTALAALAIAIILNTSIIASRHLMMVIAFVGAFCGYVLTTTLSLIAGGTGLTLILSGIAVTTLFAGFSHILLYIVQSKLKSPYHLLLMGSAATALGQDVYTLSIALLLGMTAIYLSGLPKKLNAYVFGDAFAKQLGYNPRRISVATALLISMLTGSCVAVVGIVGFVGLVAPHTTRLLLGTSDHRMTIVLAMLMGSVLTTIADIGARVLAIATAQGEFPLGSITSIIGAPFLAYLIIRSGRR